MSCLLYHEAVGESCAVLIAKQEKNLVLGTQRVDLMSSSFRLPVLRNQEGDIIGAVPILHSLVDTANQGEIAFLTQLEDLLPEVTFAVAYHPPGMVKHLRWPFHEEKMRQAYIQYVMKTSRETFKVWLEKYDRKSEARGHILDAIENALDRAEQTLAREDRLGIWLEGAAFTVADMRLTAVLLSLYQLGLEGMWVDGSRPHLSMYVHQAFHRPSVLSTTQWKSNAHVIQSCEDEESEDVKQAHYALLGLVGLAGIYIARKVWK